MKIVINLPGLESKTLSTAFKCFVYRIFLLLGKENKLEYQYDMNKQVDTIDSGVSILFNFIIGCVIGIVSTMAYVSPDFKVIHVLFVLLKLNIFIQAICSLVWHFIISSSKNSGIAFGHFLTRIFATIFGAFSIIAFIWFTATIIF